MCYAGFFDHDGSPMSRIYPEDDFWFDLTSKEQKDIRTAMALFRFVLTIYGNLNTYLYLSVRAPIPSCQKNQTYILRISASRNSFMYYSLQQQLRSEPFSHFEF